MHCFSCLVMICDEAVAPALLFSCNECSIEAIAWHGCKIHCFISFPFIELQNLLHHVMYAVISQKQQDISYMDFLLSSLYKTVIIP